jgi:3-hydroxyacyl-CoA dehydrogenase
MATRWPGLLQKKNTGDQGSLKNENDKEIQVLDRKTLDYKSRVKPKFSTIETAKAVDHLYQRLKMLVAGQDKAGEFYRQFHYRLFSYISNRIPEISDEIYRVDDAMMAGFGWEIGAFESWDVLGVERTVKAMKEAGFKLAPWVDEMLALGNKSFYKVDGGKIRV